MYGIMNGLKTVFPHGSVKVLMIFAALMIFPATNGHSDQPRAKIVLVQAVMCESIENFHPVNPAVVFSISQKEVFCFTDFDPVIEKTIVFHKWFNRDKLISTMQLTLNPPKWSSFSRIQIRDEDKGPWRVEIRDAGDNLLQTLRFSMAD